VAEEPVVVPAGVEEVVVAAEEPGLVVLAEAEPELVATSEKEEIPDSIALVMLAARPAAMEERELGTLLVRALARA
jgi:hypothetical protein